MSDQGTMDLFTRTVVDLQVKGHSFESIAEREGTTTAEVVRAWKDYCENRAVKSHEEWLVLHELRLENLLQMAHDRLAYAQTEDLSEFRAMLDILDRVEKLQGLNKERKAEAVEVLARINEVQSRIILAAFETLQSSMRVLVDKAFENKRTIKEIRAEVSDVFDNQLMPVAQQALMGTATQEEEQ